MPKIKSNIVSLNYENYLLTISPKIGIFEIEELKKPPTLEKLREIVGGYIEHIPFWNKFHDKYCIAFCNEEGKLEGLPFNNTATTLWQQSTGYTEDVLVGNIAVIVGTKEFIRWTSEGGGQIE